MIRLLGILVGAAVAVAVLILLVGLPEFPDRPGQDAPPTVPVESAQDATPTAAEAVPEMLDDAVGAALGPGRPNVAEHTDLRERPSREQSAPEAPPTTTPDPDHWYAFWSPFRSELAANGFVAQLQRTTGLDYRVVKLKPGIYEVAFAYSDDADIETKLAQISAATGLDIPES